MSKPRFIFGLCAVVIGCAVMAASMVSAREKETPQAANTESSAKPFCSECKTPTGRTGLLTAAPAKSTQPLPSPAVEAKESR